MPLVPGLSGSLPSLDACMRRAGTDSEELVQETDKLLLRVIPGLTEDAVSHLRKARMSLLQRRMDRT